MTIISVCLLFFSASSAQARLDLSRASVERLDNGLTLILLEDRTFPIVSIQTVYGTGAKDDPAGRLGLAHFFEHMAFRGSKNFPDTGLVSEIYAAGGEWHGYTWLDLTTYYATAPREDFDLLLDIEADRMARLDVRKEDVEAERGAVLAEMNGYANDPDSTLFDALIAAHFLTHPYRNNTIGYPEDVNAISHADLEDFYRRHYSPQNAVIAIVGDFDRVDVGAAVAKKFGKIKKPTQPRAPLTAETPRTGERRIRLALPSDEKLFKIAYPAPAASHPDFAAFLVLQALIGESAGVNFNQNDWGTPIGEKSPLAAAEPDIRTWIIPTAEPYAFVVSGSAPQKADEAKIERAIQRAFDKFARESISEAAIAEAKRRVHDALAFDVDTTEEAAHQLAYFAGIGAFDQLLALKSTVDAVTAEDVAAIAGAYLQADQRTVAWLTPGPAPSALLSRALISSDATERSGAPDRSTPVEAPISLGTIGSPPVIFQRSSLSPTVAVKALVYGRFDCAACSVDEIAFDTTIVSAAAMKDDFRTAIATLAQAVSEAKEHAPPAPSDNPLTRLEQVFASFSTLRSDDPKKPKSDSAPWVRVIGIGGDIDAALVQQALEDNFPRRRGMIINFTGKAPPAPTGDIEIVLNKPVAQAAVGYISETSSATATLATQIALYILSHGYEGRLGKEAISRRGLLYYIDAAYRPWLGKGFVTLASGVDPEKADAFRALMKAEIARLQSEPPTDAEIAEAKRHLIGRKISAAQSNEEITEALIRDFLTAVRPVGAEELAVELDRVTREDVLKAVDSLQNGAVVTVRGGGVD